MSGYFQELIPADDAASQGEVGGITPIFGFLGSGKAPTDIARHKHEMTAEAFAEEFEPKQ